MSDTAAIILATFTTLALLYTYLAWQDYRFGVLNRRLGRFKGEGWSRWAEIGWRVEDKRRKGLR